MKILGIETSCDETAVCLLEASGDFGTEFRFKVLGNALLSQASLHAQYGGVFPNLAKREHAKNLVPMLTQALQEAGELAPATEPLLGAELLPLKDLLSREPELLTAIIPFLIRQQKPAIDAIAVTAGPGLEPALWVGINFAKALASVWDLPLVAVNHMEGHIILSLMEHSHIPKSVGISGTLSDVTYPLLALLISGGHTELVLSKAFGQYELLGATRDDAAGEAFDKVARLLDLPYPGGPEISRLAAQARERHTKGDFTFTRPMLHEKNFDFSFSGLKTAVRNRVEQYKGRSLINASPERTVLDIDDTFRMQVAREFEECVADVLIEKTMRAIDEYGATTVVVGGGVSANVFIRQQLAKRIAKAGDAAQLLVPPPDLATDNALMIALAGYFHAARSEFTDPTELSASGNLRLGSP